MRREVEFQLWSLVGWCVYGQGLESYANLALLLLATANILQNIIINSTLSLLLMVSFWEELTCLR